MIQNGMAHPLLQLVPELPSVATVGVTPRGGELFELFHNEKVVPTRKAGAMQYVCLPLLRQRGEDIGGLNTVL